ncbi:MAG: N-acetylmuramic acid 6-phosphate etherase [Verrucomicrobiae bacterium]|nr:N-acetylmuramic acid 6-phosphate etherase [Verrucomicrobiae bacterium]
MIENVKSEPSEPMKVLGIEGGGTRTAVLFVDETDAVLASHAGGPANFRLMTPRNVEDWLIGIREKLSTEPDRIGIGMAGLRSVREHKILRAIVRRVWPDALCATSDDMLVALESAEWLEECPAQVLTVSGTGSCSVGRHRHGDGVKIGGRGHILGDRASSCDIAQQALRAVVRDYDSRGDWPQLGADILTFLQLNEPEELIEWSIEATKTELAGVAYVVFRAAESRCDAIAVEVLNQAAAQLCGDTLKCAERIAKPSERVQIIFNGSVFLKNPDFMEEVTRRLLEERPGSIVTPLRRPSVHGAIALARAIPVPSANIANHPSVPFAKVEAAHPAPGWKPVSASPTEQRHPRSMHFSELPIADAIALMLDEDAKTPAKILEQSASIEWTVRRVVRAFAEGGRLIYTGAGTSGRLGVLDASECPPTFRTPGDLVQGIIAGGRSALWSAVEGAEDDAAAGRRAVMFRCVTEADVVIGISASGHAPFIWGCLAEAKEHGAATVLICCNPGYRDHPLPDCTIIPDTGPEILTGSTRLKSGTATKLILNMITTLAMTHSGKVLSNLMIDLNPSNAKLRDRAIRIVSEITGVDSVTAQQTLEENGWIVRDACDQLKP